MINSDVQKLEPGNFVRIFEVDGTKFGADVLRFHNHTITHTPEEIEAAGGDEGKLKAKPIWWQGEEYGAWPVEILHWLRELGCSVVLMSATLPVQRRDALLRAWQVDPAELPALDYPRLILADRRGLSWDDQIASRPLNPVRLAGIDAALASLQATALDAVAEGGCGGIPRICGDEPVTHKNSCRRTESWRSEIRLSVKRQHNNSRESGFFWGAGQNYLNVQVARVIKRVA